MNNAAANHLLCCNCVEPIMTVSFECTECTDLVLCGLCFCCGAELGQHKRVHGYRVHNIGGPCAFPNEFGAQTEAWTSREEFRMLDMIERYNLGDWEEVQKAVNPSRSPEEIQLHYEKCYLNGRLGLEILGNVQYPKLIDHTSSTEIDESLSAEVKESVSKINPNELRLLAYMPDRDDYEKEYLNEAESIIANLIFVPDCSELDKEVILCAINMYIAQLRERCRAKSITRDYDLVAQFFKDQKIAGNTNPWKYSPYDIRRMKEERSGNEYDFQPKAKRVCPDGEKPLKNCYTVRCPYGYYCFYGLCCKHSKAGLCPAAVAGGGEPAGPSCDNDMECPWILKCCVINGNNRCLFPFNYVGGTVGISWPTMTKLRQSNQMKLKATVNKLFAYFFNFQINHPELQEKVYRQTKENTNDLSVEKIETNLPE
ncbi:WAP-type 'four-disulfide core [Trichinella nativa]|uniref:WAP-type 'four-disulfide core n=1 Tax=Trichinella nativa TaxID=6335 RepID=A0A1Y3E870_9BILA|nr:WAP-type 'four-disulfide core [Trichinella nativa]